MADGVTESTVKLQLDEMTGEMVSKSELKRRFQKRQKQATKAASRVKEEFTPSSEQSASKPATKPKAEEPLDPDVVFKQGFLLDVFKERPTKPVVTRFPPGPNGYLHLGHAKAIAVNFGFSRYHGGKTVNLAQIFSAWIDEIRFDDTNPDEEEEIYFTEIVNIIKWLGFTPDAITYSSDNFQKLYELARELIKKDKAYVCHCTEAEIKMQRGGQDGKEGPRFRCKHADQDAQTNLNKFRDMHDGKYEPQAAFLRMKQDITSGNPTMWDIAAYRIPKKKKPHIRAPEWVIFPTYDFTHCLCDSFEGITHSLCSTEFIQARETYEWLIRTLGVYEPMQREFGRLNVTGTIMSKRRLKQLIEEKIVRGWDDPRLYTLVAIRRRGVPPGAILSFVNELGVTTSTTIIQITRFEQSVRRYLEHAVPRLMLVLDPIPVTIEDLPDVQELDVPFSPGDHQLGMHKVRLTKTVYIDRSDFREVDSRGYFRLAPGKTVGLLQVPHPIKAVSFSKDESSGRVNSIQAVLDKGSKPKTYIQWVPEDSRRVEVRIHTALFKSDDPMAAEGGFLKDINPDSEAIYPEAMIEEGFDEVRRRAPWPATTGEMDGNVTPENVRFQAMRVAYFAMDSDSTDDKIVLNRIVSLKEDTGKN